MARDSGAEALGKLLLMLVASGVLLWALYALARLLIRIRDWWMQR